MIDAPGDAADDAKAGAEVEAEAEAGGAPQRRRRRRADTPREWTAADEQRLRNFFWQRLGLSVCAVLCCAERVV